MQDKMARSTIMMMIAACLCVGLSLSRPDMNDLDAADGEFEIVPLSNNEMDSNDKYLVKRDTNDVCPGCKIKLNVTDPAVIKEFKEAWAIMPREDMYRNVTLVNATLQIVDGMMYTYNATAISGGCFAVEDKCYLVYYIKAAHAPVLSYHNCESIH